MAAEVGIRRRPDQVVRSRSDLPPKSFKMTRLILRVSTLLPLTTKKGPGYRQTSPQNRIVESTQRVRPTEGRFIAAVLLHEKGRSLRIRAGNLQMTRIQERKNL